MITPSFSLTATERVLPKLDLDFTTASLDPRVTLTRALNTATVTNSSGNVVTINADLPRFEYNPVTLACKGLLIEESRINSFVYSENFNSWTLVNNVTISSAFAISPAGTQTADKITGNAGSSAKFVAQTVSLSAAPTVSVYVKAAGHNYIQILNATEVTGYANFDITANAGAVGSKGATASASSITNVGNGWYRITVSFTIATGSVGFRIYLVDSATAGYNSPSTSTGSVYFWGAQIESGTFPTSYIPNLSTGTTTRNADVATMTGTNFSSWYNQSQGALYAEITGFPTVSTGRNGVVTMKAASAQSSIAMGRSYAGGTVNVLYGGCFDTNVTQAYIAGATVVANTPYKMCMAYKANSFAISVNGAAAVQDTAGTVPSLTNMEIGCYDGTYFVNSCVKKVMFYIQRLTNAEVQAFTKQ